MELSLKNKNNYSEDEVNRIIIKDFLSFKNDNKFDYLIYNDKFNFIDF